VQDTLFGVPSPGAFAEGKLFAIKAPNPINHRRQNKTRAKTLKKGVGRYLAERLRIPLWIFGNNDANEGRLPIEPNYGICDLSSKAWGPHRRNQS
jgi:hypothetical protein